MIHGLVHIVQILNVDPLLQREYLDTDLADLIQLINGEVIEVFHYDFHCRTYRERISCWVSSDIRLSVNIRFDIPMTITSRMMPHRAIA